MDYLLWVDQQIWCLRREPWRTLFPKELSLWLLITGSVHLVIIRHIKCYIFYVSLFCVRIKILGFLYSKKYAISGNYGLEDQILALNFIKENIKYFNGDPDQITLGGESAGAAAVSALALSDRTKGIHLFLRVTIFKLLMNQVLHFKGCSKRLFLEVDHHWHHALLEVTILS